LILLARLPDPRASVKGRVMARNPNEVWRIVEEAALVIETVPPYGNREISRDEQQRIDDAKATLMRYPEALYARYVLLANMVQAYQQILEREAGRNERVRKEMAKAKKAHKLRLAALPKASEENKKMALKWRSFIQDEVTKRDKGKPPKVFAYTLRQTMIDANLQAEKEGKGKPFPRVPGDETIAKEIRSARKVVTS